MFRVGELIMVASTVEGLAPATYKLFPIGATQLAQTPRGTPPRAPSSVFPAALLNRTRGSVESNVSTAAPKQIPNVIPMRLVHIQLTVVWPMRVINDIAGVTGISASKLNTPFVFIALPLCIFLSSAG